MRLTKLAIFLCLLLPARALAHDPGLSAADLRLPGGRLVAHLTFARGDIETLAPVNSGPRLEALAREALTVSSDGRALAAGDVTTSLDDSNGVHFHLVFTGVGDAPLTLRSALVGKLALGHRQYLTVRDGEGRVASEQLLDARHDTLTVDVGAVAGRPNSFAAFLLLGVEHILTGFDHLVFLLALLLAGGSLREAAKIITSFTLAHSITLALATLDLVRLPPQVVEPLIALSIVYVGLENLLRREHRRRWLLTFGFGLIHGFGFASVLAEIGIGAGGGGIARPLLAFNLGVELGQLALAALALPLIWRLRRRPAFSLRYAPAASLLVALAGGYWLLARTVFSP